MVWSARIYVCAFVAKLSEFESRFRKPKKPHHTGSDESTQTAAAAVARPSACPPQMGEWPFNIILGDPSRG